MSKSSVDQWDTTASNNSDVGGVNIAEGCPPGNINDALRNMMAQIATYDAGIPRIGATVNITGNWTFAGAVGFGSATISFADGQIVNAYLADTNIATIKFADAGLRSFVGNAGSAASKIPYSTGADVWAELDFLDQDDMSSDSATALPSQQSVKAYVDSSAIGVGQTWTDVSGSRTAGTSYQNTTGRPIMVAIADARSNEAVQVSDDNSTWLTVGHLGNSGTVAVGATFIVPDDHYYRVNGSAGGISSWAELR